MLGTLKLEMVSAWENALLNVQQPRRMLDLQQLPINKAIFYQNESDFLSKISLLFQSHYSFKKEVPFVFTEGETLNGSCVLSGGQHFICLNERLLDLESLYLRIASTNSFRKFFRDLRFSGKRRMFQPDGHTIDIANSFFATPKPKNLPARIVRACTIMARFARAYLLLHELGHAKNGHLSHRASHGFLPAMDERVALLKNTSDHVITQHTLEMDADVFAYMQLAHLIIENNSILEVDEAYRIEELFALLQFSVYTLLRVFDRRPYDESSVLLKSHPPGFARSQLMLNAHTAHYQASNRELSQYLMTLGLEATVAVEEAIWEKTGIVMDLNSMEKYYSTSGHFIYPQRLLQRWALIRDDLERHLLGGGLAPKQEDPA